MKAHPNFCIILAGGTGKRLWPVSRQERPKQFIDFFGTGRTLLQQTFDRVSRVVPPEHVYVSTFQDYVPLVREQLPQLAAAQVLAEPVQLSTAPAAAWASCRIARQHPDACVLLSPCDQLITGEADYEAELRSALDFVGHHDVFLALGVPARQPNTAYGYIQMGAEVGTGFYAVRSFTEKPDAQYARMFIDSGEFLWNTGLFAWNAHTFRQLLHTLMPELEEQFVAGDTEPDARLESVQRFYAANQRSSIDLVILEKSPNVLVKPCSFGWADVGSWPELHKAAAKDVDGNAVVSGGKVLLSGCRNNMVSLPQGRSAVVRGLEGYLVAECGNMLVICPNDDPALAKRLVKEARLKLGEAYV